MQLSNITIKNDEIQLRQSYAQISMDMRLVNPPNRQFFAQSHIRAKSGQLRNSHFHTFKIWLLTPWVIKPCLCKDKAKGEWFNMPFHLVGSAKLAIQGQAGRPSVQVDPYWHCSTLPLTRMCNVLVHTTSCSCHFGPHFFSNKNQIFFVTQKVSFVFSSLFHCLCFLCQNTKNSYVL